MRSLITGVVALAAVVGVELPLALADGTTSPGDTSVFVTKTDINLNCIEAAILTATIKKGKPHHVLMVQAMMLFEGYLPPVTGPAVILARPRVNGIGVEPSGNVTHFSMTQQCPPNVTFCTVTGIFWLDLDAAEDAHKGMFLGQPLDIALSAEACNSGGGVITHATMVGQLLEK
jgi:hypothetical protein